MHLRRNALQIAKLYTGFTIAVIVLVGAGALAFASYERGTDLSLAAPRTWEMRTLAFGQGRASLRTVWREGRISYQLRMEPYPPEVIAAVKEPPSSVQRQFKMEFLDGDGFRLFSHSIEAKELALVLRQDGTVLAVEARGDRQISRDAYQRADRWDIRWGYD